MICWRTWPAYWSESVAADRVTPPGIAIVTEGTGAIVELATIGTDGSTGTFRDRHGGLAW